MHDLTQETNTAVLLITHNMGVVRKFAEKVYVIFRGVIVEEGSVLSMGCYIGQSTKIINRRGANTKTGIDLREIENEIIQ